MLWHCDSNYRYCWRTTSTGGRDNPLLARFLRAGNASLLNLQNKRGMTLLQQADTHKKREIWGSHIGVAEKPSGILRRVEWYGATDFRIVWPCIVIDSVWIKPTDALSSNFIIGIITLHVSGSLSAHRQEFLSRTTELVQFMRLSDRVLPGSGRNGVRMFHPDSARKRSLKTCMKLTNAECTVENSWWWAEKMSETCRVL
jgi:hypothetical protein